MFKPLLILSLFSFCSGCAGPGHVINSDLSDQERAIEVFDTKLDAKQECKKIENLKIIEATSGSTFKMGTYEATTNSLKIKAFKAGGNAIYMIDHSKNAMADQATAKVIRCKK